MPLPRHCICEQYSAESESIRQDWVYQWEKWYKCAGAKSLLGTSLHWAGVEAPVCPGIRGITNNRFVSKDSLYRPSIYIECNIPYIRLKSLNQKDSEKAFISMDRPTGHAAIAWSGNDTTIFPLGRKADIQIRQSTIA